MAAGGIDTVLLDWGGTLTPFHLVDLSAVWAAVAEAAVGTADPERTRRAADGLLQAELACWRRAAADCTSTDLDAIFAEAGVPQTDAALRTLHDQWVPHTWTDPEAGPALTALRDRGLRIGVLSNTTWPRAWHRSWFERDGILDLIDGDVYSSEIARTKPHPEAFRAALAAAGGTDPARCVFVGDQPVADVHGAKTAGMRAVLIPHSPGMPAGDSAPDAVIDSLKELPGTVDRWR